MDRRHADRLGNVTLPNAGIAKHQNVIVLFDEPTRRQVEDLSAVETRVKGPIKRIKRLNVAEASVLYTSRNEPVAAPFKLIMYEHRKEVQWAEVVRSRLLSANG